MRSSGGSDSKDTPEDLSVVFRNSSVKSRTSYELSREKTLIKELGLGQPVEKAVSSGFVFGHLPNAVS